MSRLRASLSNSPVDREIQGQISVAERAVANALELCIRSRNNETYGKAYVARVRRDLERALDSLQSVRRVVPAYRQMQRDLEDQARRDKAAPEVEPLVEAVPEVPEVPDETIPNE